MKNKRKFTFLPLVFATGLILSGCFLNPKVDDNSGWAPEPVSYEKGGNSSKDSGGNSSNSSQTPGPVVTPTKQKFIVTFMANGLPVQVSEVEEGQKAVYTGATPTKRGDAESKFYRFKKWDRDLNTPIIADTVFNAMFTSYENVMVVDDFESYNDAASMMDAGWVALGYNNTTKTWTEETNAAVSLSTKSVEGRKSLRFDAWENGTGYKFAKLIEDGTYNKAANALKFRLMVPSINTVKVLLHAKVEIEGQMQAPSFTYTLHPTSSEFVEYVIPLADDGWALWGDATKSMASVAGWTGVHQDDITNYLTRIEFYVEGNDGIGGQPYAAFLDALRFVTLDEPENVETETMGSYNRYTGNLVTGETVKIDIKENGDATATVVDMKEPPVIPGKVTVNADKVMTFTSADQGASLVYSGRFINGGQQVEYVSASGELAPLVNNMALNAVQVVDNFEQYETDGQAYHQSGAIDARSGCRGAYYSEYYAGGTASTTFGGSGWSLLGGDGSQLKLKQDKNTAHSGNNYLCLKHSKSVAFRYLQWGLYDGTSDVNAFRGSKLSFWAKTNGLVNQFTVRMFSQSLVKGSTLDTRVKSEKFTQTAAIGEWKHFEVALNPNLVYYGYMISMDKNTSLSSNESYLYIDDVEVYTANPYAVYVPDAPATELQEGQVFYGKALGVASMTLTVKADNKVSVYLPAESPTAFDVPYSYDGDNITLDFGNGATYTGKINATGTAISFVSAAGEASQVLNNLSFAAIDVVDNGEGYNGQNGTMYYQGNADPNNRSGLRGAYYCDWYSSGTASPMGGTGWALFGGNGDQLSLESSANLVHSGKYSMKMRRNNGANMRYTEWGLYDGTATAKAKSNYFVYWVKNPNATALKMRVFAYYQQQVTAGTQGSNRTGNDNIQIPANSDWTRVVVKLDSSKTYYGVTFIVEKSGTSSDYIYVDDAMFLSEDNNFYNAFSPAVGATLSGTIVPGPASITIGQAGACTLTCEALGGSLQSKYSMFDGNMEITVPAVPGGNGTVIRGTYGFDNQVGYTLTITNVTGDMAQAIQVGTVFTLNLA